VKAYVLINEDLCKGCEICVHQCPTNTLSIAEEPNNKGYYPAVQHASADCTGCRQCAIMCPEAAIEVKIVK